MSKGLLLDTHIWLWFALSDQRLAAPAREAIEQAITVGSLRISIMSVWETSMLETTGRICLGNPVNEWMEMALALPGLTCLPLEVPHILDAHRLPGSFHKDPADRLLVATARHHDLTLITEDRKILDYAQQGYVRASASSDKGLLNR